MGQWRIGNLDQFITIEKEVVSGSDSMGQPIRTWATHVKCFAAIRPLKARERFRGERYVFEDFQFFVIRWVEGIAPTMRIAHDDGNGTRYFNIRNIAEMADRRRRYLEITGEAQE